MARCPHQTSSLLFLHPDFFQGQKQQQLQSGYRDHMDQKPQRFGEKAVDRLSSEGKRPQETNQPCECFIVIL
jgi:hypothetical protein